MSPHREPLRAELERRLGARREGRATAWDVLVAAGHVWRDDPDEPLLRELPVLSDAELRERATRVVEAVHDVDDETPREAAARALAALDDVVVVAALVGRRRLVSGLVERAVGSLRAFPEPWAPLADDASARLEALDPDDPAWALWAAVEASVEPVADEPGDVPPRVLEALGLPVVVRLDEVCGPIRMAAASGLPAESPWLSLARGPGWELALTTDPDDVPVVLLTGREGRFLLDGREVAARRTPEGAECRAEPGRWAVVVDAREVRFEVRP